MRLSTKGGNILSTLLVKLFVKNYRDTDQGNVRTAYTILAGVVGIICNFILFGTKALIGAMLGSIAVVADAFNNLSDAVSSVISLVGAKLANRPADEEHPFGHGRYEYIAAFIVAFLVVQVGFSCAQSAVDKMLHPSDIVFSWTALIILAISVLVKLWLGIFNRKLGKTINSTVLKATAADAMGDVLTTSATIASLLIFKLLGWNIDGIVGLIVALVVMWAGISIAKDTLKPLLGEKVDFEMAKKIRTMVEAYEGVYGTHDLIVHNYGPTNSMATIHAEVSNRVDVEVSHELIDRIEREVTKATGVFLVIHMDPIEVDNQKVVGYRNQLQAILESMDPRLSAHDIRMVMGEEQINMIFDMVVPFDYNEDMKNKLLSDVINEMKAFDSRCQCVITMENDFVGRK